MASINAATTVAHSLRSGLATTARRSSATPHSAAAPSPSHGTPTAATHDPSCDAPAANANASEVTPLSPSTTTVVPRTSPCGSNVASGEMHRKHLLSGERDRTHPFGDHRSDRGRLRLP